MSNSMDYTKYIEERKDAIETLEKIVKHSRKTVLDILVFSSDRGFYLREEDTGVISAYVDAQRLYLDLLKEKYKGEKV